MNLTAEHYLVTYRRFGSSEDSQPIIWGCEAHSFTEAKSKCRAAYPDATIVNAFRLLGENNGNSQ